MTDNKELLRQNFLKYLQLKGVNQAKAAKEIDIPASYLSDILNQRGKNFTEKILIKVAEAFPDLNLTWMLSGEGNMLLSEINKDYKQDNEPALLNEQSSKYEASKPNEVVLKIIVTEPSQQEKRIKNLEIKLDKILNKL